MSSNDPPKFNFGNPSSEGLFGASPNNASGNSGGAFGSNSGTPSTSGAGIFGSVTATSGEGQKLLFGTVGTPSGDASKSPFGAASTGGSAGQNTSSVFGGSNAFGSTGSQSSTGFSFGQKKDSSTTSPSLNPSTATTSVFFTPNKTPASSGAEQPKTSGIFGGASNPAPGTGGMFPNQYAMSNPPPGSSTPALTKFGVPFGQNPSTTPAGPPPSAANISGSGTGTGQSELFQQPAQQQGSTLLSGQANTQTTNKPASNPFGGQSNSQTPSQTPTANATSSNLFGGGSQQQPGGQFGGQKSAQPNASNQPSGGFFSDQTSGTSTQAAGGLFQPTNSTPGSGLFSTPQTQSSAQKPASAGLFSYLSGQPSSSPASTPAGTPATNLFSGARPNMPTTSTAAPEAPKGPSQNKQWSSTGTSAAASSTPTTKSPLSLASMVSQSGTTSTPATAPTTSSPFSIPTTGAALPMSSVTPGAGLFSEFKPSSSATPNTNATAGSSAPTTGAPSASASAPSLFGTSTATAGSIAAPSKGLFGAATTSATTTAATTSAPTATATAAPATAPATGNLGTSTSGPAPPPQSRLKNKTMEEIITRWASDLTKYQKEFQQQAEKVSKWDMMLVENGKKISDLYNATFEAERQNVEVERQLSSVEGQQDDLSRMLDVYEAEVNDLYTRQIGHGETLQGPDKEREQTYKLAEKLNDRLDEMGKDLTSMIEEINNASMSLNKHNKPDDPLSQIVKVLNSHLSQLQWIDQNAAALQAKVTAAQKASQSIGSNGYGLGQDAADDFYRSFRGSRR